MPSSRLKIAVIGLMQDVTIGRVDALRQAGEIAHLDAPIVIAGGGGGIAFHQIAKSDAEVHLFTAFGNDDAARTVEESVGATGGNNHVAGRDEPHTRDIVMITPGGERTIIVVGEPLQPRWMMRCRGNCSASATRCTSRHRILRCCAQLARQSCSS